MRDTIIWRGMVVLLSSGALACATGEEAREDSAIAAVPPADTAAVAVPQATDSIGDTTATPAAPVTQPAAGAPAPAPIGKAPVAGSSIRAADTVKERRGYDRAIKPDFNDPSKRLPPAPDSSSPR